MAREKTTSAADSAADNRRILGDYKLGDRIYRHDVPEDVDALAAVASENELHELLKHGVIEGDWTRAPAAEEPQG